MAKPRVFIGSSVKGLRIAQHAQAHLRHDADVATWEDANFRPTHTPIENLMDLLPKYDFGLFILHPEDVATVRDEEEITVRDNVIFELGLFMGKLGRSRIFFIAPQQADRSHRNWLYLPTDLAGITPPEYNPGADNVRASVATSLDEFRRVLEAYAKELDAEEPETTDGILIDTERDFQPVDFVGRASFDDYDRNNNPIGPRAQGKFEIVAAEKAMRINRTNKEGRYEIEYRPHGPREASFRKSVDRRFHVNFKARAEGGRHEIRVLFKNIETNKWVWNETATVQEGNEQEFEFYLRVPASADLLLRLDDRGIERIPSSVTISSLRVVEIS
jgi:hypothetical protein